MFFIYYYVISISCFVTSGISSELMFIMIWLSPFFWGFSLSEVKSLSISYFVNQMLSHLLLQQFHVFIVCCKSWCLYEFLSFNVNSSNRITVVKFWFNYVLYFSWFPVTVLAMVKEFFQATCFFLLQYLFVFVPWLVCDHFRYETYFKPIRPLWCTYCFSLQNLFHSLFMPQGFSMSTFF